MKNFNYTIGNRIRDLLLVAQYLKQLRHRVLPFINVYMVLFLFNNVIYVFFIVMTVFLLYVYVWLP